MSDTAPAKTILLVEDEALIAMNEAAMLEKHGFGVAIAYNAEKAIETAVNSEIDLVLMDIDLGNGKMDGTEAAEIILQNREVPIVFLTGHSEKEMVDKVKGITRYGYVLKNTGEFVLLESINMAFELFQAHRITKESEEKYRAAFVTSPDSININRLDGLYLDINEGFSALTGYTRDDVIGKLSSDIEIWAIPEDREKLVKGLRENGVVDNLESQFRCKDGSIKTAVMSAHIIEMNGGPHILSVTRDITARKEIENQLKSRERRFMAIFEMAAEGILIGNNKGAITDANRSFVRLAGYTKDELIGNHITILFTPRELQEQPLEFKRIHAGETITRKRSIVTNSGVSIPVLMTSTKVEDDCLQSIFHDISDRIT